MNEQNNLNGNVDQTPQPAQNTQVPPVTNQVPASVSTDQNNNQVINSEQNVAPVSTVAPVETPVAPPEPSVTEPVTPTVQAPVQNSVAPEATAVAAPVQESAPVQVEAVATNTQESATQATQPAQTQVVQQPTAPQPVATVVEQPVAQVTSNSVEQQSVQATLTTSQPAQTDIVAQAPLNPLANETAVVTHAEVSPSNVVTPQGQNGVITPSVPLTANGGAIDSSNVGFVAVSAPPKKKKNKPLIITIVLLVLVGLALLGYFVIYPFVINKFFSDPKKVYETVIKSAFNELSSNATELIHDKVKYELNFSFDSNISTLEPYGGYTYGLTIGVDPKEEAAETKFLAINKNNQSVSYESYLKDGKKYLKYHNKSDYIYAGEANLEELDKLFKVFSFKDLLDASENVNSEEINYLINKLSDLLVTSIDDSKLTKEEASINVDGKTLKVINNKYVIDAATAEATIKHIVNGISDDDKAVDILAKMFEMESSTLKENLKSTLENNDNQETDENEDNMVCTFSIYTTMGFTPTVIGYGLVANNNDDDTYNVHYYSADNYFELKADSTSKDTETNKEVTNNFDVIGRTSNGKTKVSISLDDSEILTLNIKDWNESTKNFDYTIKIDDLSTITGSFKYTKDINDKRLKNSLEFSLEMGEQFVALVIDFNEDWSSTIANIDTSSSVTLSDDQINDYHNEFLNDLYETPIGELFKTVSGDVTPAIDDYYSDDYYDDYSVDFEFTN